MSTPSSEEAIFETFRRAVGRRALRDAESAPDELGDLLRLVAARFTDDDFSVDLLLREGLLDRRRRDRFRAVMGCTLGRYLVELRGDLAARLLTRTPLSVGVIARRLGYTRPTNFSRAFKRWSGWTPEGYRAAYGGPETGVDRAARELLGRVRARHGLGAHHILSSSGGGPLGGAVAWAVWRVLRDETPAMQAMLLHRRLVRFRDRSFFDILSRQALGEGDAGRVGSDRRVHWARLAVSAVGEGEPGGAALAEGRIRLGLAELAAGETARAGAALELARLELGRRGARHEASRWRAESDVLEGHLLLSRGRFEASLRAFRRAAAAAARLGIGPLAADARLRAAAASFACGRLLPALAALAAAERDLDALAARDWRRRLLVERERALVELELGDAEGAQRSADRLRHSCRRLSQRRHDLELLWIEGALARRAGEDFLAEKLLRRASRGLESMGDGATRALVALDLARLCLESGRERQAFAVLGGEVAPYFRDRSGDGAALTMAALDEVLAARWLPAAALQRIRRALWVSRWEPEFPGP